MVFLSSLRLPRNPLRWRRPCLVAWVWLSWMVCAHAADTPGPAPSGDAAPGESSSDVLIFADGDRTRGKLVGRDGDFLVFQSRRFGELRVKSDTARVESIPTPETTAKGEEAVVEANPTATSLAQSPVPSAEPVPAAPTSTPSGETAASSNASTFERIWESPADLAVSLFHFLGPWRGRFAIASSLTQDTSRGTNLGVDLTFSRKWEADLAKFETHYYLSKTDDVVDTDLLKGNGTLRHDFKGPFFINYRPTLEWNRNHTVNGAPADYVLLQQAIGVGVNLLERGEQKIGLGIAENSFDLWTLPDHTHSTRDSQSIFIEFDLSLPWRITFTNRDVYFYSFATGEHGWEDQFELVKRFSDTLSLGLRREARRNNPDKRIADYSLLRVQLGLDF